MLGTGHCACFAANSEIWANLELAGYRPLCHVSFRQSCPNSSLAQISEYVQWWSSPPLCTFGFHPFTIMVMWPNLGQLNPRRPSILPREVTKKRHERPHENHYVSVFKYLKLRFSSSKLGTKSKVKKKKRGKKEEEIKLFFSPKLAFPFRYRFP
jgi:hypothetical protein